jgi:hypothetical protein
MTHRSMLECSPHDHQHIPTHQCSTAIGELLYTCPLVPLLQVLPHPTVCGLHTALQHGMNPFLLHIAHSSCCSNPCHASPLLTHSVCHCTFTRTTACCQSANQGGSRHRAPGAAAVDPAAYTTHHPSATLPAAASAHPPTTRHCTHGRPVSLPLPGGGARGGC